MIEYCYVKDIKGKKLSPTKVGKAWYLIRKNKAILTSKYPMAIQLNKEITNIEKDNSEFIVGIDDGSKHVGIAIVQKCKKGNKVVFKGTIELRQDVSHLMTVRTGYRRYHRNHKRYRPRRFNNRASSKRKERVAPSIKQKKDSILRVLNLLNKHCKIDSIILEDIQIDIRKLQDGILNAKEYQKSNRLDENLRTATLMRDKYTCQQCGRRKCMLHAHHITPKRLKGNDSIYNLITLCEHCHNTITGKEEQFSQMYYNIINGKNINFIDAQHSMQGKTYLRNKLNNFCPLSLTTGSQTASHRILWGIEKTHSNDAIVITGVKPDNVKIKEFSLTPMRRQSKAIHDEVIGFKHRDIVKYTKKNGESYTGYITALYPEKRQFNMTIFSGKELKRYSLKNLNLIWRFNKIRINTLDM